MDEIKVTRLEIEIRNLEIAIRKLVLKQEVWRRQLGIWNP